MVLDRATVQSLSMIIGAFSTNEKRRQLVSQWFVLCHRTQWFCAIIQTSVRERQMQLHDITAGTGQTVSDSGSQKPPATSQLAMEMAIHSAFMSSWRFIRFSAAFILELFPPIFSQLGETIFPAPARLQFVLSSTLLRLRAFRVRVQEEVWTFSIQSISVVGSIPSVLTLRAVRPCCTIVLSFILSDLLRNLSEFKAEGELFKSSTSSITFALGAHAADCGSKKRIHRHPSSKAAKVA